MKTEVRNQIITDLKLKIGDVIHITGRDRIIKDIISSNTFIEFTDGFYMSMDSVKIMYLQSKNIID